MAEELLDVADVGATGQEMRDAGVPQTMHGRAAFLIKSRREAAGPAPGTPPSLPRRAERVSGPWPSPPTAWLQHQARADPAQQVPQSSH